MEYGSDLIVRLLRDLGVEYVSLNPGGTIRGLHDSIVNYGGNRPQLILCCHEEIAVAIAQGYARATGRPMAVLLDDIVGLLHASMAIFNAWADRDPILVLGGTAPLDLTQRLPKWGWVHVAPNQGELVRNYVKWEEQAASPAAIAEVILRGYRVALTEPKGPVYLCFPQDVQQARLSEGVAVPPVASYPPPWPPQADPQALRAAAAMLVRARSPLIIADRLGRNHQAVDTLMELAELLGAPVIDRLGRFNFPNTHPLNLTGVEKDLLPQADVILALDVSDLYQALAGEKDESGQFKLLLGERAEVIHISLTDLSLRSWWGGDCRRLLPVALPIMADTGVALPALVELVRHSLGPGGGREERAARLREKGEELRRRWWGEARRVWEARPVAPARLTAEVWEVVKGEDWALAHTPIGDWSRRLWSWTKPDQWAGESEAAGQGRGLGISIGFALAHRGTGRICIDLQGDGDFLYTPAALWTAAHLRLPLLIVMFNNRAYYNTEAHQREIAQDRGRPVENAGIGNRLQEPPVDFAQIARGFDLYAEGPISEPEAIQPALARALAVVKGGSPALVDVVTSPR